jgi:hypothetical protein
MIKILANGVMSTIDPCYIIFGEKDDDPVEVYPVWNDEYLNNIRIDENYLKGIVLQYRGKLKDNYYIITPETCTLTADTTMKIQL